MQVKCPHCGTVFEGNALSVHFCPNCGKRIDAGAPGGPATPEPGAPEQGGPPGTRPGTAGPPPPGALPAGPLVPGPTPWERRRELGFFQGFFQTWKESLLGPDKFWQRVLPNGSLWDALSYAWINSLLTNVITLAITLPQRAAQRQQVEQAFQQLDQVFQQLHVPPNVQEMLTRFATDTGVLVRWSLGGLVLYPLSFIITTAILHLFCLMFGVSKNGFNATARAFAYAMAPVMFSGIPCVGVFGSVYFLVLTVMGLSRLQQTTTGRAAAAVLVPIAVLLCCTCLGLVAAGVALAGASR